MEPTSESVLRETKQLDFSGLSPLIGRYHGSKTAQNWQSYMLDLLSVSSGVKYSWLIDYFSPNCEKLKTCASEIFRCFNLTHEQQQLMPKCFQCLWCSTCIVSLNQDVLMCNVELVLALCRNLTDHQFSNSSRPIDSLGAQEGKVSSGSITGQNTIPLKQVTCKFIVLSTSPEKAPQLATPSEEESIILELCIVAELLLESLLPLLDKHHEQIVKAPHQCRKEIPIVNVKVPPDVNLCTVFGWLLGYPVVYWFPNGMDSTSESPHQSSLGLEMLPLLCYKIQCKHRNGNMEYFSSSKSRDIEFSDLYSFSIPEKLDFDNQIGQECVRTWFENLSEQKQEILNILGFTSLVLSVTKVCLPQVNL